MRGVTIKRTTTTLAALAVLGTSSFLLPPGRVFAQFGRPSQTRTAGGPAVRDNARIFGPGAVSEATRLLDEVQKNSPRQVRIVVETVDSFGGKTAKDVAAALGKAENIKGLIVLISKGDQKVWVESSDSAEAVFSKAEQAAISDAITKRFKKKEFDQGLLDAAAEARRAALVFGVRDHAGMFKPETVEKANVTLDSLHKNTKWNAVIETVETLGGKEARDLALTNAKALDVHGLYILLAKKEHKLWSEPSGSAKSLFTNTKIRTIDDAIMSAFKAGDFDKGLLDGVAEIRKTAESDTTAVAQAKTPAVVPHLPGPGDPSPAPKQVVTTPPPAATVTPPSLPKVPTTPPGIETKVQLPGPAAQPDVLPHPQQREGSIMPFLLIVGGGMLLFLWFVSRMFRRPAQPDRRAMMTGQGAPYPQQPNPGYGPQRPNPGPAPGYGYGQPPAPAPGYGPPPQQGGGGFMSGVLGGLGGAIAGNILYDKFGRAIPQEGYPHGHEHTGHVDQQGNVLPQGQAPEPGQPAETYDPNAGVGGDWGTPDANAPDEGAGGDWGSATPADQGGGGDWGSADAPAAEPDAGGDWGSSPQPEPDNGGGGDWGGGDSGNADGNQGGGW